MSSVYKIITEKIISLLEHGTIPWHKPWNSGGVPRNLCSGREYRGINVFVLNSAGYQAPWWLSYKQALQRSGQVKRGEHGFPCMFWNWCEKVDAQTQQAKRIPFLRYYTVFNVEQCQGIEYPRSEPRNPEFKPLEECENLVVNMPRPPRIEHGGVDAFYRPREDLVAVPKPESFYSQEAFYSTLFHELTHSTGHASRLDRPGIMERIVFASMDYSKEELVAEMGSAFLCGHAGIENKILDNSASYIASWLDRLKNDPRLVVIAAGQAQKAADYIFRKNFQEED